MNYKIQKTLICINIIHKFYIITENISNVAFLKLESQIIE